MANKGQVPINKEEARILLAKNTFPRLTRDQQTAVQALIPEELPQAHKTPAIDPEKRLQERLQREKLHRQEQDRIQAETDAEYHKRQETMEAKRDKEATEAIDELARQENEAKGILETGRPFKYILETFAKDHEGDLTAAKVIALTFAASSVLNGEGLHVYLSGPSGRGKSHTAETMFMQLPEDYNYNRSFSDKYLFYAGSAGGETGLKPGVCLLIDDQTMSEGVQEIFKVTCGKFQDGVKYGTVQNQKAVTLTLPPRVAWVLLKVDDPGDDQVMNRLVQARIQDTPEKVIDSARRIQEKYRNLRQRTVRGHRREVMICRRMWSRIKQSPVAVEVPCAGNVLFTDNGRNLRNHELFFNLLMAHTVIHQWQRKQIGTTEDGVPIIEATFEDFKEASDIFDQLYSLGGQAHNTIKTEDQVVSALLEMKPERGIFTIREVAKHTGMDHNKCYRALHGRRGQEGEQLGGLLTKCEYIQKGGKRSSMETAYDSEYVGSERISRRESYNEDIYQVDINGLASWAGGRDKPVRLRGGFRWDFQAELK